MYPGCTSFAFFFRGTNHGEIMAHTDTQRHTEARWDTKSHTMSSNLKIPKICEFCKNTFIARTTRTRYCSHTCNSRAYKAAEKQVIVEKIKVQTEATLTGDLVKIKAMEYLNVDQAALLFGISRRTIYRLVNKGCLNVAKFGRRTVLRRADIESLFSLPITTEIDQPVQEFEGIESCYSISEVQKKFNVSPAALYNLLQQYGIAKYAIGRYTYVAKRDINLLFNASEL